ncbi:hypothetical protein ACZ91_63665 [Streptomyces regensis]|nr:hypothetical protein ACZ91_63665 [Streptomyces regensis]
MITLPVRIQIGDTPACEAGWIELDPGEPLTGAAIAGFLRGAADICEQVDQEVTPDAAAAG